VARTQDPRPEVNLIQQMNGCMDDTKYHYQLGNRIRWVKLADSIPEEDELWEEHGNAYDIGQDHFRCLNGALE
jgi:hypothetical protein